MIIDKDTETFNAIEKLLKNDYSITTEKMNCDFAKYMEGVNNVDIDIPRFTGVL
jgi:hypothetical protein